MKRLSLDTACRSLLLFVFSCMTLILAAQDSTGGSTTTTITKETTTSTTTEWYTEPWVWAVGGGVLLIVLIALLRGRGRDREVTRTTVIKDDRGY